MTAFPSLDAAVASGSGAHTRVRVLRAAVDLFSERGFEATTMRQLAEAAQVSAPALYNHFANKEALLVATVEWMMRNFVADVMPQTTPPPADCDPLAELEKVVRLHVGRQIRFQARTRAYHRIVNGPVFGALPPEVRRRIREMECDLVDYVADLVRRVQQRSGQVPAGPTAPTAKAVALMITSCCAQVHSWYSPDGPVTPEQFADHTWELSRRLLRPC